ncbi:hypothetical protein PHLGIDRAFT_26948 [Phlebiopsis gigantea 11061_1 CR5-6]|uniref:Uncharacterized protein n=1 Tax=Phlebiopsis gigantea (strain 11061_1 CR5-6) TaxID=745531 RepID=A0A0C3NAP5_PHLG1|nr:hypothetical protein PHLGIDRAFT_26948 [Phlebiopsis gigantea 11061_1 CR5-6]
MPASTLCQKSDLKPSADFKDSKRARASTRASQNAAAAMNDRTLDDQPFTQRGRKYAHRGRDTITIQRQRDCISPYPFSPLI